MTRTIDPPLKSPLSPGHTLWSTLAVSEDLSHALVVSLRQLTPGAVEDQYNVYVKDIASNTYEFVATSPEAGQLLDAGAQFAFIGGTPDFSAVSFTDPGEADLRCTGDRQWHCLSLEQGRRPEGDFEAAGRLTDKRRGHGQQVDRRPATKSP